MNARTESGPRVNGLVALGVLVIAGVGVTAGYLQWKAPDLAAIVASRRGAVAAAPTTPEGRVHAWLDYGNAFMHSRLTQMRLSAEQPWLVTHAVRSAAGLDIFGIDLSALPRELGEIDGLSVRVRVPIPTKLGTGELTGEHAPFVPIYERAADAPDPVTRARELVAWAVAGVGSALERDIAGATLVVEVGPATSWPQAAEAPK
jgi:hypothetical protein